MAARPEPGVVKVSVSIPAADEAWVRERAQRTGRPFSAVVKDAIEEARRAEARRELLDWLLEGQSAVTQAELDGIDDEWRAARRAPVAKRKPARRRSK